MRRLPSAATISWIASALLLLMQPVETATGGNSIRDGVLKANDDGCVSDWRPHPCARDSAACFKRVIRRPDRPRDYQARPQHLCLQGGSRHSVEPEIANSHRRIRGSAAHNAQE